MKNKFERKLERKKEMSEKERKNEICRRKDH